MRQPAHCASISVNNNNQFQEDVNNETNNTINVEVDINNTSNNSYNNIDFDDVPQKEPGYLTYGGMFHYFFYTRFIRFNS